MTVTTDHTVPPGHGLEMQSNEVPGGPRAGKCRMPVAWAYCWENHGDSKSSKIRDFTGMVLVAKAGAVRAHPIPSISTWHLLLLRCTANPTHHHPVGITLRLVMGRRSPPKRQAREGTLTHSRTEGEETTAAQQELGRESGPTPSQGQSPATDTRTRARETLCECGADVTSTFANLDVCNHSHLGDRRA